MHQESWSDHEVLHDVLAVQVMTDLGFEVDFKLKGVITCLNRHGFTTTNSCQVSNSARQLHLCSE